MQKEPVLLESDRTRSIATEQASKVSVSSSVKWTTEKVVWCDVYVTHTATWQGLSKWLSPRYLMWNLISHKRAGLGAWTQPTTQGLGWSLRLLEGRGCFGIEFRDSSASGGDKEFCEQSAAEVGGPGLACEACSPLILTAILLSNSDTNNYRKHLKHKLSRGLDQLPESSGASWDQGVSSWHLGPQLLSFGVPTIALSMTTPLRWEFFTQLLAWRSLPHRAGWMQISSAAFSFSSENQLSSGPLWSVSSAFSGSPLPLSYHDANCLEILISKSSLLLL